MKQLIFVVVLGSFLVTYGYIFEQPIFSGVEQEALDITKAAEPDLDPMPVSINSDVLQGKVIKSGLFKVIRSGGLVSSKNTSTGQAISKPVIQLVKTSDRIPLVKDAHMSLHYRIWNLPQQLSYIKLRRVLKHPAMTLPDGKVSTGSDYMINGHVSIGQVIAYTGYGLNEDYEMLEGDWTFQIWYQNKKLVEQTFTTYIPDDAELLSIGNLSPKEQIKPLMVSRFNNKTQPLDKNGKPVQSASKRAWIK